VLFFQQVNKKRGIGAFSPGRRRTMSKIYIIAGPGTAQSFEIKGDTIFIGRGPDNDIQVKEKSVSRKHVKIIKRENSYFIEDLNSKNGTFIQGTQIHPGKVFTLEEGTPVAIGNVVICVGRIPSVEEREATVPLDVSHELSDDDMAVLDSLDIAREISEGDQGAIEEAINASQQIAQQAETFVQDRPLTPQKNVELIYKVSSVLMQSLNVENINGILETILNYILDLLKRLDRGVFILIDTETGEITGLIPILKRSTGDSIKVYSRTIVNRVIKERKPVIMLDTDEEEKANLSESIEIMKIRSVMCVPLISRSKMRGVIYVDSINKPHGFRKEDLSLLTALSIPAAYAIENATMPASARNQAK
jgi:pSer/pThr/pTyr-binding forkhead associated (FHA) protein